MLNSKRFAKRRRLARRALRVERLEGRRLLSADFRITEFLARNDSSIADEDGRTSDWIEIRNVGASAGSVDGWFLTDDAQSLTRWRLPDVSVEPGDFLVVFASGSDRTDPAGELHTDFQLDGDGEYLALVRPDGTTVASQFAPEFPSQHTDVSYGISEVSTATELLGPGEAARVLIPTDVDDAAIGTTWTGGQAFLDDAWTPGTTGVGFDLSIDDEPGGGEPAATYSEVVLADQPIGYWRLGENAGQTTAQDSSPNGNHMPFNPTNTSQHPAPGQTGAMEFDGNTAYALDGVDDVLYVRDPDLDFASGQSFSIEFWMNTTQVPASNVGLVTNGYDSSAQDQPWYLMRLGGADPSAGLVDFYLRGPGGDRFVASTTAVNDGDWHHVAAVYDAAAATIRMYVDGGAEGTTTGVAAADYGSGPADRPFLLGRHIDRHYQGLFDEVAVYASALSDTQVAAHYQAATGAAVPDDLKVDFGSSDGSGNGPGGTQPGFVSLEGTEAAGTAPLTRGVFSSLATDGSVDVTIGGYTHFRDYAAVTGALAGQNALLSDMALRNEFGTMTLTLDDLAAGVYEITTYHHSTQFGGGPFDIHLTDALVTNANIFAGHPTTGGSAPTAISTATFSFTCDGSPVAIDFIGGTASQHVSLNGFELVRTGADFTPWIGLDVETAMHEVNASAYVRIPFQVDAPVDFDRLELNVRYDDGFVAYLNGTEVARRNAPTPLAYDSHAAAERDDVDAITAERIDISAHEGTLVQGQNILAVHALNLSAADGDLLLLPELVGVNVLAEQAGFFDPPTPGEPNGASFAGFVGDTRFSVDRAVFDTAADAMDVEIVVDTPGATIVYTTDGSAPTADASGVPVNGTAYTIPIHVDRTTTLRAAAFLADHRPSNVDTQTYLFLDDVLDQGATPPAGYPATWGNTFTDWGMDQDPASLAAIAGDANMPLADARETVKESLRSLPTMSIVMDVDDIFGAAGGIYANTQGRGMAWERPASVELFDPSGQLADFQIDAGIRVQGFTSRYPDRNPKHSLRLTFRSQYGAGRLDYPLFGPEAADSFDTLVLRSNSQDAWVYNAAYNRQGQFVRDQWARETQLAMGQPSPHGTWVHLYVNGLYWGVYNPTERPDDAFNASYLGGDEDDYDVLKNHEELTAGTFDAYNEVLALLQNDPNNHAAGYRDFSSDAAYQAIQGNNPDGTHNPALPVYVDVENLIDYMIHNMYADALDWPGNFYIGRDRTDASGGFRFFDWDNEHGMKQSVANNRAVPHSRDNDSPTKFHHALSTNAEYRLLFADHVQRAFFDGGVLYVDPDNPQWDPDHPERNVPAARWMELTGEIEQALVAESARWGDVRDTLYTPHNQFQAVRNDLLANWFPDRSANVLGHFRGQDMYPDVAAPSLVINGTGQHGGTIASGDLLSFTAPDAEFHVDTVLLTSQTATTAGAAASALVPSASDDALIGSTWTGVDFVEGAAGESAWTGGAAGVGFDNGDLYDPLIGIDVGAEMYTLQTSVYVRIPFTYDAGADFDNLLLRMKYDDGFVAYINGVEVARRLAPVPPDPLAWNSAASGQHADAAAVVYEDIDVSAFEVLLEDGGNVLAIHGLNRTLDSTDLLIAPELVGGRIDVSAIPPVYFTTDGTDPRLPGGAVNDAAAGGTAQLFVDPTALNDSATVKARSLAGGQWSAVTEATFLVNPATAGNLAVSEVYYHPELPTGDELVAIPSLDNDDFEFIELMNISDRTVYLGGVSFATGDPVEFTFPDSTASNLVPGGTVLVVQDRAAFELRFGAGHNVAGEIADGDGQIGNGGERITLLDAHGQAIHSFRFNDRPPWPEQADGFGASLQLIAPQIDPDPDQPANWTAAIPTPGAVMPPTVVSRHVYYDGSAFDAGGDMGNDAAVATGKTALLPGQAAGVAHITNFASGINGVMIDVSNLALAAPLDENDFAFATGNDDDSASWRPVADPQFAVREGAGRGGADRIVIAWEENAVKNAWLQVTLRGGTGHETTTGLPDDDVFYFGNAVGEVTSTSAALGAGLPDLLLVNAADVVAIRDNPRGPDNRAPIDGPHDVDRNGFVDAVDLILARNAATGPLSALRRIMAPESPST